MKQNNATAEIILALDVDNLQKAEYFVEKLSPQISIFKVGIQLFTAVGPKIIEFINQKKAGVFLDLKFFDIPHTVANAVRQATRLKIKMLTLHIAGGKAMLQAAQEAAEKEAQLLKVKRPLLIGVTVLTSQQADADEVLRLARCGLENGLDGVVCSAQEAGFLRKKIKKDFIIVTPGIRLRKDSGDDQKRTATPEEAIKSGSNFLVVGRPILEAEDPLRALKELV